MMRPALQCQDCARFRGLLDSQDPELHGALDTAFVEKYDRLLPERVRRVVGHITSTLGIEYTERSVEPTRTVYNSSCADTSDCEYGWTEESYVVRVTGREPPEDERCDDAGAEHGDEYPRHISSIDRFRSNINRSRGGGGRWRSSPSPSSTTRRARRG